MTKNNRQFREFLRDEVNLPQSRLHRLQVSVRDVNRYLKANLTGYQSIDRQGSYGLDTLVKPVKEEDEYDADIQIVMNPVSNWDPDDYLSALCDTLGRNPNFAGKLKIHTRCVTMEYAWNFHLDVVPRIAREGRHFICNRSANVFEETDGPGYRNWFSDKSRITKVNLKRVVRLLKYLRDRQGNYVAKSILLTTLCGNAIHRTDRKTEAVRTVANTLTTVLTRMDSYLQGHQSMPMIRNPALRSEDFNRHWDQQRYAHFRERVHSHARIATEALASPSIEDSIVIWRRLFGRDFGRGRIPSS